MDSRTVPLYTRPVISLLCGVYLAGAVLVPPALPREAATPRNDAGWLWVASVEAAKEVGAPAPAAADNDGAAPAPRAALEQDPNAEPEEPIIRRVALATTITATIVTAALLAIGTGVSVEANQRQETNLDGSNGYTDSLASVASGLLFSAIGTGAAALISGAFWAGLYAPQ